MAAHRYWRVNITAVGNSSGDSVPTPFIATMELRESTLGSNLAVSGNGTGSASSEQYDGAGAWAASKAFDANAGTSWYASGVLPHSIMWDFGAGNEKDITHLTLVNSGTYDAAVTAGALEFSDDASGWTTLATFTRGATLGLSSTHVASPPGSVTGDMTGPIGVALGFGGACSALLGTTGSAVGYFGSHSSLTNPTPTLVAAFAGWAALSAPSPTLYGTARSSEGENSFTYTAPRATLSAFGGANAKLKAPSPSLAITATVMNFGRAALQAPSATLSAAGKVSGTGRAALTYGNNVSSFRLIGYGGAVASITLTGSPTVQATGTTGSVGKAAITAPLFELTASGTAQNYGSALLTAPAARLGATARAWISAPGATLTAIGSAVVIATYEAYAVNLNHTPKRGVEPVDEATRYTNFPFTHVVRYKNSYFGANATGLYLLEGTTDDGADISYALKTTTSDLDSPNQKTVASAYFSGRLGPEATVTLYAGEGAGVPYAYNTVRGALAQNHREVFGKGIKQHRYYALGLSGSDVLELDNVELDVKQMNRRI